MLDALPVRRHHTYQISLSFSFRREGGERLTFFFLGISFPRHGSNVKCEGGVERVSSARGRGLDFTDQYSTVVLVEVDVQLMELEQLLAVADGDDGDITGCTTLWNAKRYCEGKGNLVKLALTLSSKGRMRET